MKVVAVRGNDSFSQLLREGGVEVINAELVDTQVLDELRGLEERIERLDEYDGVFFTSPVAAGVFIDRVQAPVRPVLYALGNRAATALRKAGFHVETRGDANTANEMLSKLGTQRFDGKKLLFIRGERSMDTIRERLSGIADLDEVVVYRTIGIELSKETERQIRVLLTNNEVGWVCFFSPSAAEAFEKRFGIPSASVASIGETTAGIAKTLGFNVGLVASRAVNEVFAAELIAAIKEKEIA